MTADMLDALLATSSGHAEQALAARYAPIICFDAREPFLPLVAGYTIFRAAAPSPSFERLITLQPESLPPAACVIEYAIWWDWDIQHLYELEHVWVYLDEAGQLVYCEASWHGGYHSMRHHDTVPHEGERAVVYAEPGKHAFAPAAAWFAERAAPHPRGITTALAGSGGLLVKDMFKSAIHSTPLANTLARSYLAQHAFTPSLTFSQRFTFAPEQLVPWPALRDWIPQRIAWWLAKLAREIAPEQRRPLQIGHRGAAAHAPDNSLAGIAAAARLGADAVEIDLHCTHDGIAVASHDAYLLASDGCLRLISALTAAELHASGVPTLDDVILSCREHRLGLYLELKDHAAMQPTLERLAAHGVEAIIGCFRPDWLADLKALAPDATTSVLFSAPTIDAVALAAACGATYVHPCWERRSARPDELLTSAWVERARAADLGIISWHEERPQVIAGLRQRGLDGICSDQPELLVSSTQR